MQGPLEVSGPPIVEAAAADWVFERIEEWSRRLPDQSAFLVEHAAGVDAFRYADVLKQANEIACAFRLRGIQPGDRIGILMETIPQWVFILLGAMRAGIITVPIATTLPEPQIENIVRHSGCRMVFADETNHEKACNVGARLGNKTIALNTNDPRAMPWSEFVGRNGQVPEPYLLSLEATVLLIYTSGTTGEPKGVQLTMANLICEIRGIQEPFEMKPGHRLLAVLPFSHVLPLVASALGPLCLGAGVVFLPSISPQKIVEAFNRHRITFFICVPQFFYLLHQRIFSQVEAQPWIARKAFHVMRRLARLSHSTELRRKLFSRIHRTIGPELRFFASGGSRFDPEIARDLNELGYTMLNAYGLTETSAAVTATPVHQNRIGTVGRPLRGVSIRIDSPNDAGVGEICVNGPLVMKGYYRDETHTAESIRDGWFYTGDLGVLDREGNLAITGRLKEVIVLANGKNIYPEEIESHYARSPYIKEICILGLAEGGAAPAGERLHAIVVPDMDEFRRLGKSAIMERIRFEMENLSRDLPSYQHVLSLSIRNEPLPRTVTRKLKRFEIQAGIQPENRENGRRGAGASPEGDHARFRSGIGEIVATAIRKVKPGVGRLDPASNIELDLGFDSLSRIELLTEIEATTGAKLGAQEAAGIYSLEELLDAVERQAGATTAGARGWKEMLSPSTMNRAENLYILKSKPVSTALIVLAAKAVMVIGKLFFQLRWRGAEKIPKSGPFLICPNHESFLDAPLVYAALPPRIIANSFGLGYSDYWRGAISRRVAEFFNIVAIDQNVNLVRAMQVAAAGLRHNRILMIFPEGTRSIDGRLTEFKKGAAILARELGVPILPVGINGTFEAWPRKGGLRLHPVDLVFGDPIDPRRFDNEADPEAALTHYLHSVVETLSAGRQGRKGLAIQQK